MKTYTKGTKLYCDFIFGGKPKAVCLDVLEPGRGWCGGEGKIQVKITEDHKGYRKGEILTLSSHAAVPLAQNKPLEHGQYFTRINTQYEWK